MRWHLFFVLCSSCLASTVNVDFIANMQSADIVLKSNGKPLDIFDIDIFVLWSPPESHVYWASEVPGSDFEYLKRPGHGLFSWSSDVGWSIKEETIATVWMETPFVLQTRNCYVMNESNDNIWDGAISSIYIPEPSMILFVLFAFMFWGRRSLVLNVGTSI